MNFLETTFGELGISQYLGAFIDQGFDSWDTILDITESDLDALGVKLGHRRKLQRRIANYRGVAPDVSLVSPARTSIEDARHDANRADFGRANGKVAPSITKRKYRRHPKTDENAPERPPSAYVLFSNKMREDLKGQNLTFTEIAKLVGENWQNLGRAEKDPYERQANDAKEKYNQELARYRRTAECRKYGEYLLEFRKRQAIQSQEKDAAKRLKTDAESTRGSSTSRASTGPGGTSGNGSGSESHNGSEPPPSRQQRLDSIASLSAGLSHVDDSLTFSGPLVHEESHHGRRRGLSSPRSGDTPMHRRTTWVDGQCLPGDTPLPWVDSKAAPPDIALSPKPSLLNITPSQSAHSSHSLRGSGSSGSAPVSRPSYRQHERSSHGSLSSSSASSYQPRTPNDASLPIHALLSTPDSPVPLFVKTPPLSGQVSQVVASLRQPQSSRPQADSYGPHQSSNSILGFASGSHYTQPVRVPGLPSEGAANPPPDKHLTTATKQAGCSTNGLDGISALLKAREIVDRRR